MSKARVQSLFKILNDWEGDTIGVSCLLVGVLAGFAMLIFCVDSTDHSVADRAEERLMHFKQGHEAGKKLGKEGLCTMLVDGGKIISGKCFAPEGSGYQQAIPPELNTTVTVTCAK